MASAGPAPLRLLLRAGALSALLVLLGGVGAAGAAVPPAGASPLAVGAGPPAALADRGWQWPVDGFRMERPYAAPAHRYGSGHRGIDLRPIGSAEVRAPAGGHIAFSGRVADRAVLTIDHGDGLVTTLEPIESSLQAGEPVARGDVLGAIALGGHTTPGALHFGVRLHGEYINPLLLLGGVPRAVLLPCC